MSQYITVDAKVGKSTYRLSEYTTPGMLRISRYNPNDGRENVIFIPEKLVFRYLAEKLVREPLLKLLETLT